jgi:hypothetical protein
LICSRRDVALEMGISARVAGTVRPLLHTSASKSSIG